MWTCPKCGATVEASFEVCWRCGTSFDGVEDPSFVSADDAAPIEDPDDYLKLRLPKEKSGDLDELPEPLMELVPCFTSNSIMEAKFVLDQLLNEGIMATVDNVLHGVGLPVGWYSQYPARVVVHAKDLPRAGAWVEDYRERQRTRNARAE